MIVGGSSLPGGAGGGQSHAAEQLRTGPAGRAQHAEPAKRESGRKARFADDNTTADILANDQLLKADDYKPLIVGYHNGAAVKLSDVADVEDSVEDMRAAGYVNGKPASC